MNLVSINVSEDNKNYSSEDRVLFNKNKTILQAYPAGRVGHYIIPDSVRRISGSDSSSSYPSTDGGAFAFSGLTSITISEGVKSIGKDTFMSCLGLTSVIIPANVTEISSGSFRYCSNLKSVTILGDGLKIGYYIFPAAIMNSIYTGSGLEYEGGVFAGCSEELIIYTIEGSGMDKYAKENGHKVEYIQTFW